MSETINKGKNAKVIFLGSQFEINVELKQKVIQMPEHHILGVDGVATNLLCPVRSGKLSISQSMEGGHNVLISCDSANHPFEPIEGRVQCMVHGEFYIPPS